MKEKYKQVQRNDNLHFSTYKLQEMSGLLLYEKSKWNGFAWFNKVFELELSTYKHSFTPGIFNISDSGRIVQTEMGLLMMS